MLKEVLLSQNSVSVNNSGRWMNSIFETMGEILQKVHSNPSVGSLSFTLTQLEKVNRNLSTSLNSYEASRESMQIAESEGPRNSTVSKVPLPAIRSTDNRSDVLYCQGSTVGVLPPEGSKSPWICLLREDVRHRDYTYGSNVACFWLEKNKSQGGRSSAKRPENSIAYYIDYTEDQVSPKSFLDHATIHFDGDSFILRMAEHQRLCDLVCQCRTSPESTSRSSYTTNRYTFYYSLT